MKLVVVVKYPSGIIGAVIKSRGPGISPGYYEGGPWLLSSENRRIEPKEIPSCLIPPAYLMLYLRGNLKS